MPVDDRTRLNPHRELDAGRVREEADTLMAHPSPVTSTEVATEDDLGVLDTTMRSEIHTLGASRRGGLRAGPAAVRSEAVESAHRPLAWTVTAAATRTTAATAAAQLVT